MGSEGMPQGVTGGVLRPSNRESRRRDRRAGSPGSRAESPEPRAEPLGRRFEAPDSRVESLGSRFRSPDSRAESRKPRAELSGSRSQPQISRAESQDSRAEPLGSRAEPVISRAGPQKPRAESADSRSGPVNSRAGSSESRSEQPVRSTHNPAATSREPPFVEDGALPDVVRAKTSTLRPVLASLQPHPVSRGHPSASRHPGRLTQGRIPAFVPLSAKTAGESFALLHT
jgi:hypothetical protein